MIRPSRTSNLHGNLQTSGFGTDSEVRFVIQGKQIMPQISLGEIGQEPPSMGEGLKLTGTSP